MKSKAASSFISKLFFLWLTSLFSTSIAATTLWFMPPSSNTTQQGFIRISNLNSTAVSVTLSGIDDAGITSIGTVTFNLLPYESKEVNSHDIEYGNTSKGLVGSIGTGTGNWRLVLSSSGPVDAQGFIRTITGFLTSVQDPDPNKVQLSEFVTVPIVNPGGNPNQVSIIRLVNPNSSQNTISIFGTDDSGTRHPTQGNVTMTLGPQEAVQITSSELENGDPAIGLSSGLGAGVGKWRLQIIGDYPFKLLDLLYDPSGSISEIPTESLSLTDTNYYTCDNLEGAIVLSQEQTPVYLGFFGSSIIYNSITNSIGPYGSTISSTSMQNDLSNYGSQFSNYSVANSLATLPPVVIKNGIIIGHITINPNINGLPLSTIVQSCTFLSVSNSGW